jgi:hypothetical protein
MPYWGWIPIGLAAVVIVVAFLPAMRVRTTRRLRHAFGSEYDRAVDKAGSRSAAEAEVRERQSRHESFDLRPLEPQARENYLERWRAAQERFIDDPRGANIEADELVLEVMRERGYPIEDIDRRAADISVEYPEFVDSYRFAHDVAVRQSVGEATTEDLRTAMRHYRGLFDELLETGAEERLRR